MNLLLQPSHSFQKASMISHHRRGSRWVVEEVETSPRWDPLLTHPRCLFSTLTCVWLSVPQGWVAWIPAPQLS